MNIRKFLKHIYLLSAFFRASAIADLEYRMNIVMKIFGDILWYSAQLSIFYVIFQHTRSISGWDLYSTRVFMGVLFTVDSLWMLLFSANLDRLSDKVRRGELDLLLVKPLSSQFVLSFQRMSVPYLGNFAIALSWLMYSFFSLPNPQPSVRLLSLLIAVPSGLAITYGIRFFFSASALIFERAENINYIWYQIYRLGTRPDGVYPVAIKYLIFTFLPVAFIASVPARSILQAPEFLLLGSGFAIAVMLVWCTTRFWAYGLRKYASASS